MKEDVFIQKTKTVLDSEKWNSKRFYGGFDFDGSNKSEECILVVGLNPAGDPKDPNTIDESRTYFYSFPLDGSGKSDFGYNRYFKPIYDLVNEATGNLTKWAWCNKPRSEIEKEKNKHQLTNGILTQYDESHARPYTLYVGDMFYYHQTDSKHLPFRDDFDFQSAVAYCREMLKMHLDLLRAHNKRIKFVYINNAQVSRWLCNGQSLTHQRFEDGLDVDVFYGSILSGGRMDEFSRMRLINEIALFLRDK